LPIQPLLKRENMIEQAVLAEYEKIVAESKSQRADTN
jgi:hypothetical protein